MQAVPEKVAQNVEGPGDHEFDVDASAQGPFFTIEFASGVSNTVGHVEAGQNEAELAQFGYIVPTQLLTDYEFEIIHGSTDLNDVHLGRLVHQIGEAVDRFENQRRPGSHIAGDDEYDGTKILEQVLVAHAYSMRFSRLKFGVDTIEFDDDGAVDETEAQLTKPGHQKTVQRFGFEVLHDDLAGSRKLNSKKIKLKERTRTVSKPIETKIGKQKLKSK